MRSLHSRLTDLLPKMARASQELYDDWEQDADGYSYDYGHGGICDAVAMAWESVICQHMRRIGDTEMFGDGHACLEVLYKDERCVIDLPAYIYEHGGGYSWTKRPGITITSDDFYISRG